MLVHIRDKQQPYAGPTRASARGGSLDASFGGSNQGESHKRKSEDGTSAGTRAKRNRYTSIACNECKRRKIKCNGETPCQRCGNLSLDCLYTPNCCSNSFKDSDEYKQLTSHLLALQDQVDALYNKLSAVQSDNASTGRSDNFLFPHKQSSISTPRSATDSPSRTRSKVSRRSLNFKGPTSPEFSFHVAQRSLQNMGVTSSEDQLEEEELDPNSALLGPSNGDQTHSSKDPLWSIDRSEALRLCNVFDHELVTIHPLIEIDRVIRHCSSLYRFMEAATAAGIVLLDKPGADGLEDDDTNILKMVLAITLVLERAAGAGEGDLGERLFESVRPVIERRLFTPEADFKGMVLLSLASMYFFQQGDDEGLAWRLVGHAMRLAIELGLHRKAEFYSSLASDADRAWANRFFWAIYVLDRRWSFGTGMQFSIQDSSIDPDLPEPDDHPYLKAMIEYSRMSSSIFECVTSFEGSNADIAQNVEFWNFKIREWYASVPPHLQFLDPETNVEAPSESRTQRRLRVLLYLRANSLRIVTYRKILQSAIRISENRAAAETGVGLAQDIVRVLTHLNQTSDIYRAQQILFNYFLVSALALLFLAVSHAPVQFSHVCRDEFYMALDLVKGFSAKSSVSKRLWKTIKGLKEIGPRLGLGVRVPESAIPTPDAHSSAAVAMAGLAGHAVGDLAVLQQQTATPQSSTQSVLTTTTNPPASTSSDMAPPADNSPLCGTKMSHEFASLFEGVIGLSGLHTGELPPEYPNPELAQQVNSGVPQVVDGGVSASGGGAGGGNTGTAGAGLAGGVWSGEQDLNRVMRELF